MNKNNKKILQFSLIIIVLLIIFIISILYVQPSLFFYSWHDEKSYNQLFNEENFEEIKINNNGKLLNGWIKYNTEQQHAPLLIFFGGNAQNVTVSPLIITSYDGEVISYKSSYDYF